MRDFDDILRAFESELQKPHDPQLRIYLSSETNQLPASFASALPDFDVVATHSGEDVAFLRQIAFQSEDQFKQECNRVATAVASLLPGTCQMICFFDGGTKHFETELRKASGAAGFIEEPPPNPA